MIHILVCDDEMMIRKNFIKRINRLHIPIAGIHEAENGIQALKVLQECSIHICLLDINMPLKNGLELLRELNHCSQDTRFIIISGYDNFQYAKEAICYGVYRYLLKPINREEFEEAVLSLYKEISRKQQKSIVSPVIRKILDEIEYNYRNPDYSRLDLAEAVMLSEGYITRLLKREMGTTFSEYLTTKRIEKAKQMIQLEGSCVKLYEVAEAVGYKNQHYFSQVFKKLEGVSPKEFME